MKFPEAVKAEAIGLTKKISRTGKYTKPFNLFQLHCSDVGVDLTTYLGYGLSMIKYCIKHDLVPPKCSCGNMSVYYTGSLQAAACSIKCRSADPSYRQNLSNAKNKVYSDPQRKTIIESKKIATCFANHGVLYPMQSATIHAKH